MGDKVPKNARSNGRNRLKFGKISREDPPSREI